MKRASETVQIARDTADEYIQVSPIDIDDLAIIGLGDSSFVNLPGGKTQSGHVIAADPRCFLNHKECPVTIIDHRSRRIPRVCVSTLQAGTCATANGMPAICWVRGIFRSILCPDYSVRTAGQMQGLEIQCTQMTNASSLYDHVTKDVSQAKEERARYSVLVLKDDLELASTSLRWRPTAVQLGDALTKAGRPVLPHLRQVMRSKWVWGEPDPQGYKRSQAAGRVLAQEELKKLKQMQQMRAAATRTKRGAQRQRQNESENKLFFMRHAIGDQVDV